MKKPPKENNKMYVYRDLPTGEMRLLSNEG